MAGKIYGMSIVDCVEVKELVREKKLKRLSRKQIYILMVVGKSSGLL